VSRAPVIVLGAGGRMGRRIIELAETGSEARVVGAVEIPGSQLVGRDAGEVAGTRRLDVAIVADFAQATAAVSGSGAVAVDFTIPEAAVEHARHAAVTCTPIVVGTTGFSPDQRAELERLAERTPLLLSANMSVGVNVLLGLVGEAVRRLGPSFEIEIVEMHHNRKKDAPSGTALALAEEAARAAGSGPDSFVLSRQGMVGERKKGEIGVVALRGGDNVGEHTVMLVGTGERLELVHRASSRDCLATGAVRAAAWLHGKPPGLYSMRDVLGLAA
jgi:4-hydroxy-tetrahydrodipicolinate reductase